MLKINEIFKDIQGESSYIGLPTVFVRFTGCNLRCTYCDTVYAYYDGKEIEVKDIISQVKVYNCPLVDITGGEPLLQNDVYRLIEGLLKIDNKKILIETNGSIDIRGLDERVIRIMDIKCPDSGMSAEMKWENIEYLRGIDEIKFVVSSRRDYEWSINIIKRYSLEDRLTVLISPAYSVIEPKRVAGWILNDQLKIRFQPQLHKIM
ncbi:MAG: radical SAM protein [Nitrospinae bacterium]|nr:radical SAM protein [Nitrospinota bacterium]